MAQRVFAYKMILFGNEAVGKTSLVERFVNEKFEEDYHATLGYNVYEKQLPFLNFTISLIIYDIGGQEKFRDLRKKYAEGANTAFIVYDITDRKSYDSLSAWKSDLSEFAGNIPFFIIGNKFDLQVNRQVPAMEALNASSILGAVNFFEVSAKTGEGVEDIFKLLAIKTYEYYVLGTQAPSREI
jgi:small GTP-binding protein